MQSLLARLTSQVGSEAEARSLLISRGHMDKSGKLTAAGKKRQAMGPGGRAIDRAVKASGGRHKAAEYAYDAKTNQARLR
jgi:plasmid replication initiation protein